MDALFTLIGIAALLVLFGAVSVAIGADSRDGFVDATRRPAFR
jgi:hypothetical protein